MLLVHNSWSAADAFICQSPVVASMVPLSFVEFYFTTAFKGPVAKIWHLLKNIELKQNFHCWMAAVVSTR